MTNNLIARAETIRQSIAAAERYLLTLDEPKERERARERVEQLKAMLRTAR